MKTQTFILPLLILWAGASSATSRQVTPKLIPAFDQASKGINYGANPRNHIYAEVRRVSPDGKYIVRLMSGDGEVARLQVYRYVKTKTKTPTFRSKDVVSKTYVEADGVAWVPKHGHWLVISSGGGEAVPQITLWTGKSKRVLRRELKHEIRSPYESEMFDVRSVSADGRFIIYDRSLYGINGEYKLLRNLKLSLPRS